ncbi:hypothetical protein ACFLZV_03980 [Candidatus Margulisiibacteriota bacterium]
MPESRGLFKEGICPLLKKLLPQELDLDLKLIGVREFFKKYLKISRDLALFNVLMKKLKSTKRKVLFLEDFREIYKGYKDTNLGSDLELFFKDDYHTVPKTRISESVFQDIESRMDKKQKYTQKSTSDVYKCTRCMKFSIFTEKILKKRVLNTKKHDVTLDKKEKGSRKCLTCKKALTEKERMFQGEIILKPKQLNLKELEKLRPTIESFITSDGIYEALATICNKCYQISILNKDDYSRGLNDKWFTICPKCNSGCIKETEIGPFEKAMGQILGEGDFKNIVSLKEYKLVFSTIKSEIKSYLDKLIKIFHSKEAEDLRQSINEQLENGDEVVFLGSKKNVKNIIIHGDTLILMLDGIDNYQESHIYSFRLDNNKIKECNYIFRPVPKGLIYDIDIFNKKVVTVSENNYVRFLDLNKPTPPNILELFKEETNEIIKILDEAISKMELEDKNLFFGTYSGKIYHYQLNDSNTYRRKGLILYPEEEDEVTGLDINNGKLLYTTLDGIVSIININDRNVEMKIKCKSQSKAFWIGEKGDAFILISEKGVIAKFKRITKPNKQDSWKKKNIMKIKNANLIQHVFGVGAIKWDKNSWLEPFLVERDIVDNAKFELNGKNMKKVKKKQKEVERHNLIVAGCSKGYLYIKEKGKKKFVVKISDSKITGFQMIDKERNHFVVCAEDGTVKVFKGIINSKSHKKISGWKCIKTFKKTESAVSLAYGEGKIYVGTDDGHLVTYIFKPNSKII